MTDYDIVSKPAHYTEGRDIEPIDVIEDWTLGFHEANALKYISRSGRKDDQIQDLEKAVWYLERRIGQLEDADDVEAAESAREEVGRGSFAKVFSKDGIRPTPIEPCDSCDGSGSQLVDDESTSGDTCSITVDSAKNIASDGVDHRAVADSVTKQFEEMHRTGRMARGSSGSYL